MTDFGFALSLLIIQCKIFYTQGCGTPQDNCRDQVYLPSIQNKALTGHVIDNITDATPHLCHLQCYIEPRCVSTNFDENSTNCQLSSSEAETHPDDLVPRPGMIYQGTKNNCQNDTCPPLIECHSGYTPKGYRCIYPDKCCKVPDERILYFPRKSEKDYIELKTSFKNGLKAFTLSLMAQFQHIDNFITPFTLASKKIFNNIAIYIYSKSFQPAVYDDESNRFDIQWDDGRWHHIFMTWESASGEWKVYIDGHIRREGTNLARGKVIDNGIAIIGQDQDSLGGRFDGKQSFVGNLTSISLWDRVLPPYEGSVSFLTNFECHPQQGKVLSWEDIMSRGERHGDVLKIEG